MTAFNLETCARPNILSLVPYRCARDDYKDDGTNVLLDANENSFGPSLSSVASSKGTSFHEAISPEELAGLNRYPDPHQGPLKEQFCRYRNTHTHTSKNLTPENLFVGVGSDEAIDAIIRSFCVPAKDKILTCPPTYGMYTVSAQVNDVSLVKVPLTPAPTFGLDVDAIYKALDDDCEQGKSIKVALFCSPGNPTGGLLAKEDIEKVLRHPTWNGVVVVDEAYVDFAEDVAKASLAEWVLEWPNLIVLQTLSKGFGLAGIRLGVAFASKPIAQLFNSLKAPYNVSTITSLLATHAVSPDGGLATMKANRVKTIAQRERMIRELPAIPGVGRLRGGLDSNFLLFEILNVQGEPDNQTAVAVYEKLAATLGVVVRFRGREEGCLGCLRITVGTEAEVTKLIAALQKALVEVRSP